MIGCYPVELPSGSTEQKWTKTRRAGFRKRKLAYRLSIVK
jgi:hypothetical protein